MGMNPRLLRPTASGFDPRRIPGLALWLDAADSSTLFDADTGGSLPGNSVTVGRWEDKSGKGRHATEGTNENRPTRSTASVNGLDAILFDGSNDRLTTTSFTLAQPLTVFVAVRPITTVFHTICDGAPTGARAQLAILNGTLRMFSGTVFDSTNIVFVANTTTLAAGIFAGTSSQHRANAQVLTPTSTTPGTNGLSLGARLGAAIDGSSVLSGRLCEVLYYEGALSGARLSAVETYLMRKWGIA